MWRSLVSAPALGAGGRGFESRHPDQVRGVTDAKEDPLRDLTGASGASVSAVTATRRGRGEDGISFEHAKNTECRDARFHRHCQGRWRGSISMGFDAAGKRIRRKVSGRTKTEVQDALVRLREELGRAPKSSRTYTVNQAVADWLAKGLPGRSQRTTDLYDYAVGHLLKKFGSRPLRDLSAGEVRAALESLTGQLWTRTLGIARLSLERAIRFAQADDRAGRNVAEVIETPQGRSGRASKSLSLVQAQAAARLRPP